MMIYIVERHVEDYLHVLANVNTIRILKNVYSTEDIIFIAPKKHSDNVRKYFDDNDRVTFKEFSNRTENKTILSKGIGFIKKAISDLVFFLNLLKNSTSDDVIVISHIYPHSLVIIKVLKAFFRQTKLIVFLHGEVEYVFFSRRAFEKVIGFLYRITFKIPSKNFFYVFLTEAAKKIVLSSGILKENEFIAIELPTFKNESFNTRNLANNSVIKIAHIGSAGKRKNVNKLFELSDQLAPSINAKQVELSVIGVLEESIQPYLNNLVINFVNNKINSPLNRETFDSEIVKIDYAIFFYIDNDFLLRSSAAYFDAIFYEKPIIAFKCKFLENNFKMHGNMGYLCETLIEMKMLIQRLKESENEKEMEYRGFLENIRLYKSKLQLSNIAHTFKIQAQEANIIN